MNLSTITMEREQAQEAYREYREAVTAGAREALAEARDEYAELDLAVTRGYRWLAQGHQLLHLGETIRAGGVEAIECEPRLWDGRTERETVFAPRLAIARADARSCWTKGVHSDGHVTFQANEWRWNPRKADRVVLAAGTFDEDQERPRSVRTTLRAIVPTIPPPLRPAHKLSGYRILWEAEWDSRPPVDPALLKHLGGGIYAVVAVWDLTELERSVLGGLRAE